MRIFLPLPTLITAWDQHSITVQWGIASITILVELCCHHNTCARWLVLILLHWTNPLLQQFSKLNELQKNASSTLQIYVKIISIQQFFYINKDTAYNFKTKNKVSAQSQHNELKLKIAITNLMIQSASRACYTHKMLTSDTQPQIQYWGKYTWINSKNILTRLQIVHSVKILATPMQVISQ